MQSSGPTACHPVADDAADNDTAPEIKPNPQMLDLFKAEPMVCYTEKASNAWNIKDRKQPKIYPNDHQPTQHTDQAPGAVERAARESRRLTPISTVAVRAFSVATTRAYHLHPIRSSPNRVIILSATTARCEAQAGRAALHRRHHPPERGHTTPPAPGGPIISCGRWTAHGAQPASEEGKGGGGGGGINDEETVSQWCDQT